MYRISWVWIALLLYSAGNLTGLISQPGTIAFSFYFFERFRYLGSRVLPGADQLIAFLAGGLAQSTAVVITYPARAAKDKLQGQKEGTYTGLVDVLRKSCAFAMSASIVQNIHASMPQPGIIVCLFDAQQSRHAERPRHCCCRCCRWVIR